MAQRTFPLSKQPAFFDESYPNPTAVPSATTLTRLLQIRCRTGLRPWLTHYSQNIDAGGIATATWSLYRNGVPMYPYHAHNNQTASPFDNLDLPNPIRLEQDDLIEVYVSQTSGSNQNASARVRIEYDDL